MLQAPRNPQPSPPWFAEQLVLSPSFPAVSPQTRCFISKARGFENSPWGSSMAVSHQGPAGSWNEFGLPPSLPRSGSNATGQRCPRRGSVIHRAQGSEEGPLVAWRSDSQPWERLPAIAKHPRAPASLARAPSASERSQILLRNLRFEQIRLPERQLGTNTVSHSPGGEAEGRR